MLKRSLAFVLSFILLISPATPLVGRATGAPAPSPVSAPADGGWPRAYVTASDARLVLYEPQVASWANQNRMVMYAAASYTAKDQRSAVGTIRIEADTKIAVDERLVSFSDLTITASNFPTLTREQLTAVVGEIVSSVPREDRVIGLDRVLAAVNANEVTPRNTENLKADPPPIFSSTTPALLVNIDGDPIWSPIKDVDLRFAVNTNWDLFEQEPSKRYFLRNDTHWLTAPSVDGPWTPAGPLPDSFAKLPDDDNWKDVKATIVGRGTGAGGPAPAVFVSRKPAELILMHGAPAYAGVAGTNLFWISNTDRDVFRIGKDGPIYFLVSGRWFVASAFAGPWAFATPILPEDFKRIPLEHPRSRVLASVPRTTQALEAVLLAQVPQTARVSRKDVKAPDVVYQGGPEFQTVENTTATRAVNTDKDILKVGDLYYMCFDGVWFVSSNASGPWALADSVPEAIYKIPISSPAYNVTNVTVDSADDDYVVYAAAAAYTGMMVGWGTAVWGSGWYYPPYYGYGGFYGGYYPRYPTYGYGAAYNPWTGAYTRAGAAYGPYGGAGYAARYNPTTGTYSRGAAAWGPGGARGAAQAWNPRTGTAAATRQGSNIYGSWGSTAVQRGDSWAQTSRVTNRWSGTTTRASQGSGGGGAVSRRGPDGGTTIGRTGGGDVFAGHDGNVYRNQGGTWQKYGGGAGTPGTPGTLGTSGGGLQPLPSSTVNQLNRDAAARRDGAQRTSDLGAVRSGGSSRSGSGAGSYRPSGGGGGYRGGGGGFRGGGGRRR